MKIDRQGFNSLLKSSPFWILSSSSTVTSFTESVVVTSILLPDHRYSQVMENGTFLQRRQWNGQGPSCLWIISIRGISSREWPAFPLSWSVGQSDSNLVNMRWLPTRSHELRFHLCYPTLWKWVNWSINRILLFFLVTFKASFFSATVTHCSWALFIQLVNIYSAPTIFQELLSANKTKSSQADIWRI